MGLQYRSSVDYAQIYGGNRQGFNLGIDGAIFARKEAIERTFSAPRIGTQGSSIGDTAASTDISAGSDDSLNVAVDGGAVVAVTLTLAGLSTGSAIEAELETQINAALAAASQDGRVWVFYDNADDHYEVKSQKTGTTSAVVITDAISDNVADDLKLGTANGGTEAAGTNDQDFLLNTTGGPGYEQPAESNAHRSGRYHVDVVKQKKVADHDIDTMINMSGSAGDSIDTAIRLLLESVFGKETVNAGTSIVYEQGLPNFTYSMVRVGTIYGEYYTGMYGRDWTLTVPGDAPGTMKFVGNGEKASIAGISQVNGIVSSSTDVIVNDNESKRYTANAYVMLVKADGRTITAGADGSLFVSSVDNATHKLVLSTSVDADDDSYVVPWHPGAIQQTARDNIYTDLEGTFKFDALGDEYCVTNLTLGLVNNHTDINNCFGSDANQGFAAGGRANWNLSVTLDLSTKALEWLVQARDFNGYSIELKIGDGTGRYLLITAPNWKPTVPRIDNPEEGTTPVTLEGFLYQSAPNAKDPIRAAFL